MLMGLETDEPCRLPVPSSSQRAPPQFELSHGSKDAEEMPHEGLPGTGYGDDKTKTPTYRVALKCTLFCYDFMYVCDV